MTTRFQVGLLAVVFCMFAIRSADAEPMPVPVGAWHAEYPSGAQISLVIKANVNHDVVLQVTGVHPWVGWWSWQPSDTGGLLTITYMNAPNLPPVKNSFSVTWVDRDTITLSDPYSRATLRRTNARAR
jgi:hypothetical protein